MITNPIPRVSNPKQYRAIGIVFGSYKPFETNTLNKGYIHDENGFQINVVVLGKVLPLLRKHINLEKKYCWIVYPRNKNSDNLHLQISGVWDPINFAVRSPNYIDHLYKSLNSLNLKDNYFSIRGKLIFINISEKELIIKIFPSKLSKNSKYKSFKIMVKGVIPMNFINSFVSLEVTRKENTLLMDNYEIIEEKLLEN